MMNLLHFMQCATTLIEAVSTLIQVIQTLFHMMPPIL
ncbi:hypothetical protein SB6422_02853 [Klebsiella huaxiensis]|uniref:Uncharacterized protein n=1 Tax=Klebsiella huaxiensis TaxID=2153354 RepID=A0A564MA00_9ENTR|nr:hypothetical protein SB6422_02853 [Klebsiella huaxiensis]